MKHVRLESFRCQVPQISRPTSTTTISSTVAVDEVASINYYKVVDDQRMHGLVLLYQFVGIPYFAAILSSK